MMGLLGKTDATLAALDRSQGRIEFEMDGRVIEANDLFLNVIGYTLAEIRGQHHKMFVHPAERESADYRAFWDALRRGEHQVREFQRITKDGRTIWIQASYNPVCDRQGRPVKVVKFATDITAQKMRDTLYAGQIAALDRSQAVIHFTLDGIITDANENFLKTMGYSLDEVRGRHHRIFVSAADRDAPAYHAFWKALASGQYQAGEFRRMAKSGADIWIFGAYNPILGPDGKPVSVVKFATDITRQVEDRMRRTAGQRAIDSDIQAINHSVADVASQARTTTDAAARTSGNVQAVAAGAEEFAASIEELGRHVVEAQTASAEAVAKAEEAGVIVSSLTTAADKIGDAVTLIRSIADQTNLLALNATIEAARAGESGRGFAVVASEVKALAGQSSRATEEIGTQIAAVQSATAQAVSAIDAIGKTISHLSQISMSVSSAVTEQAAVTRDMSVNMHSAADSVRDVQNSMDEIAQSAFAVNEAVGKVAASARALA